jgi:AcrR family transcriptional regulator
MVELVAERGYHGVTIRALARLAGVSTRTFYSQFTNVEECFVYTYESLMQQAHRRVSAERASAKDWEDGIRAGLDALMPVLASNPKAAQLALVDAFDVPRALQGTMSEAIEAFELLLTESFAAAPEGLAAPRHLVSGIVAGLMRVARSTSLAGRSGELPRLVAPLMDWMLSLPSVDLLALRTLDPRPLLTNTRSLGHINLTEQFDGEYGRLVGAAVKLRGASQLTIPKIRVEAGVSRRGFDAWFSSAADCSLGAVEALARAAAGRARHWAREAQSWEGRIYTETLALCIQCAQNRDLTGFALGALFATKRAGLIRRERLISTAADGMRTMTSRRKRPDPVAAEASVAAAWHILEADIIAGRGRDLPQVAPLLAYILLAPMVGPHRTGQAIRLEHATRCSGTSLHTAVSRIAAGLPR